MFRDFLQNITNRLTFLESAKPQPEAEKAISNRTPEDQRKQETLDKAHANLEEMITRYRMEQKVDPTSAERREFAAIATKKALEWDKTRQSAQVESTHEAAISAGSKVEAVGFEELVAELAKGGFDLSPDKGLQKPVTVAKHLENAGDRYAEINLKDRADYGTSEKAQGAPLITEAQEKQVPIASLLFDEVIDGVLSQAEADTLNAKLETGTPKAFAEVEQYLQVNHAVAKRIESLLRKQALKSGDPRIEGWKAANTIEGKQAALSELNRMVDAFNISKDAADAQLVFDDTKDDPLYGLGV